MADLTARDSKLVQYLNEAYGKEKQLETALEAHIGMTTRAPYRKRLQQHLTETKRHAREVERRIKRLGGDAEIAPVPGPDTLTRGASAAVELGSRALAAAQGPLHAIRGTGEAEKMLKNAKTEYAEEHEEIATYTAIETLAEAVGDSETAKLARAIRREEQSMASFLERQIPALTRAVTQAEIPAAERRGSSAGSRRNGSRPTARSTSSSGARSASRSGAKRGTTAAKRATTTAAKRAGRGAERAAAGTKRATASGTKRATSSAKRGTTAAKRTATAAKRKTGAKRGGRAAASSR